MWIWKLFFQDMYFPLQRRWWHPIPVLLPGKFHGWRSLVGYSTWGRKESDTTEQLHFTYWSGLPFPPPGDVSDVSCISCTGRVDSSPNVPPGTTREVPKWLILFFVCLIDSSKLESLGARSLKRKTNGIMTEQNRHRTFHLAGKEINNRTYHCKKC